MNFGMSVASLMLLAAVPAWVGAQGLNLKTGAWEITTQGSMLPRTIVEKECITKSDLAQFSGGPDKDDDPSCKPVKPPSVTGNKWSTERRCVDGRSMRAEFVAESPERVVGSVVASTPKGGAPMTVQISGRWLGASCAGIPQ